jgi:hypothetical protein
VPSEGSHTLSGASPAIAKSHSHVALMTGGDDNVAFWNPSYPFDLNASRIYAKLWSNLAKKGIVIGAHDLMIASTAIRSGFPLSRLIFEITGK